MALSDTFWKAISFLYNKGARKLAAGLASTVCSDRVFSIDGDGDWVNAQAGMIFCSPYVFASRVAYVKQVTRDYWFYDYTPKASDVVFDIGAGIGEECAILAESGAEVFAIEAHPDIYRCLAKTIAANGLSNITPILCALGDHDGEISIVMANNNIANTVIASPIPGAMRTGSVTVPMKMLETLCAEHGVSSVDYVKMNIEGAERQAVRGFGAVPVHHAAISCHDFFEIDEFRTKADVIAALEERGYAIRSRPDADNVCLRDYLYAALPQDLSPAK
ncbi:MAG: FkbM family methyltransferase [Novosphingobium sp.]